ncbi:MAG: gephyrin-like molybdotransferase Glp [Pseudomonadales bacterium]
MAPNNGQWTPIDEALDQVLTDCQELDGAESVALAQAYGRVLAEPISAQVAVPPWDNSAMDGFAVRAEDVLNCPVELPISQRIPAGAVGTQLLPGTAARIFTGAPVPLGADAVIMQENTETTADGVIFLQSAPVGNNIRPKAQDIQLGDVVLPAGQRLRPQELGVLASVGLAQVKVRRRPKVALISTGDEVIEPGQPLGEGQIFNSNRYTLLGMMAAMGVEAVDYGIIADDAEVTANALRLAATECDLIVTTGGVSVGEEDHVKAQVESMGELNLWKLAIKPGKPLAYGRVLDTPILGLPGNPSAVFVTSCLVVRPYILRLQGLQDVAPVAVQAQADFDWPRAGRRQEYLRARLYQDDNGQSWVSRYDNQSSGVLSSASWGNALAVVPVGSSFERGEVISVLPMEGLF